jgi:NAD(P)-dependent dehydrogenase (short-subunit alcohol dehydrogenase family)
MAARAMFESLADEMRPAGVRVWSLLPDAVATELIANTRLAPLGSMNPAGLATLVARLVSMPMDAELHNPLVAPFEFAARGTL